jgi:predicted porin
MNGWTGTAVAGAVLMPLLTPSVARADVPIVKGLSLFATVDVGVAYQSAGVPHGDHGPGFLEYQAFTVTRNFRGSQTLLAESAIEQSKVGAALSEELGRSGFSVVGRIETAFDPLTGKLVDACGALAANAGVGSPASPRGQTANFDSSRCGQALNGVAFGGVASERFGTLSFGRQLSLIQEALAIYDAQATAPAFSIFGYAGIVGGAGSTQAARLDKSVKYVLSTGRFRIAGLYAPGDKGGGVLGKAYIVQLGGTVGRFQADAFYMHANAAVNLRSAFNDLPTPLAGTHPAGLAAFVSNNSSYAMMARYAMATAGKAELTFQGGYSHLKRAHADYDGGRAQGGYPISVSININKPAMFNVIWAGARYTTAKKVSISAGFYHISQNSSTIGRGTSGTDNTGCAGAGLLCAGHFDEASLVLDALLFSHVDAYVGLNYSIVFDGLANGFSGTLGPGTTGSQSQTTLATGVRVKF